MNKKEILDKIYETVIRKGHDARGGRKVISDVKNLITRTETNDYGEEIQIQSPVPEIFASIDEYVFTDPLAEFDILEQDCDTLLQIQSALQAL